MKPGDQNWLNAKRGGPRWQWQDATMTTREGFMERFSDFGGTDVTYWMRRDPCGTLDLVSGSRAKAMKRI
jgi:hypothetical protein